MRLLLLALLALSTALIGGCDASTCEGACSQYYGADGCDRRSILANGTDQASAQANCIADCRKALYTTTASAGGADDRNYNVLINETDALTFIQCVQDEDYTDAAFATTCADLEYTCPWFRW
jgi:hypothetical protein